jgi:hypothetical protein
VVGSGLGGLSAAALLAKYGESVTVCEAHSIAGGCAHGFDRRGKQGERYSFDSGPSLWLGCAAPSTNPLRQVLDAVGESPEWAQYDGWCNYTPEGTFYTKVGDMADWRATMARLGNGEETVAQWDRLLEWTAPLQRAVTSVPPLALRGDAGALLTATRYLGGMANPLIGLRASYRLCGGSARLRNPEFGYGLDTPNVCAGAQHGWRAKRVPPKVAATSSRHPVKSKQASESARKSKARPTSPTSPRIRRRRGSDACRCSRRPPHGPAPRACALLFRALPRGQGVASAPVDVPPEAAPARRPRAAPSRGGARANSSPSFQRPLGAPAPHRRCAHPSQPLAHLALDPGDPARAP